MKIIRADSVRKEPLTSPLFTGGNVTRQAVIPQEPGRFLTVNIVNFSKGARNKFHSHSSDQVLIVTAGKGIVATEQGEKVVAAGDIILFPAGEKHWHGATKDSDFSHIYVTTADSKTEQLEA
jgi:quercetin dioxygenase-like cupin family protein